MSYTVNLGTTAAAAAATGPAAPVTFVIGLLATFAGKALSLIGRGRQEADVLTHPPDGVQYLVGKAMAQLDGEMAALRTKGIFDRAKIAEYIDAWTKLQGGFDDYTQQFQRAGPGARATIDPQIQGRITALQKEAAGLPAGASDLLAGAANALGVSPLIAFAVLAVLLIFFLKR